ncbi:MAG: zf-HC2 domain-containing protein, partial [Acidobacteria bacterium]|nr:zf-HC2 domain-containing protein [Acidobacteriota bacterium]
MSCTLRREENLNDLLDGVLDTAGREETRAHLVACPSCRATRAELERLALRVRELPGTMAPPSDLWPDLR